MRRAPHFASLSDMEREEQMTPEEMDAAIVRNLKEKTGKTLEEWCVVLRASNLAEKRELKDLLKQVHGVGHFQAQTIVKRYLLD